MEEQTKKKNSHRVLIAAIIYALVVLIAGFFGLRAFWNYLADYESSLPKYVADDYCRSVTAEHIVDTEREFFDSLDSHVQSEEEYTGIIAEAICDGISWKKNPAASTESETAIRLFSGDRQVGSAVLSASEGSRRGLNRWEVSEEEYDFSFLLRDCSVIVPDECRVALDGVELGSDYVTKSGIEFDYFKTHKISGITPPTLSEYSVSGYIGEKELKVFAPTGAEIRNFEARQSELWDSWLLRYHCSDEDAARIQEFMNGFIDRYVRFTGSNSENCGANMVYLRPYLLPGGSLEALAESALLSYSFSMYQNNRIESFTINRIICLEDGFYFCDCGYDVTVSGKDGSTFVSTSAIVSLHDTESGLKVSEILTY